MHQHFQTSTTSGAVRFYEISENHPPAPTSCRHCGSLMIFTFTPGGESCYECSNWGCQWTAMASLFAERQSAQE